MGAVPGILGAPLQDGVEQGAVLGHQLGPGLGLLEEVGQVVDDAALQQVEDAANGVQQQHVVSGLGDGQVEGGRSEEHTSELQSRPHLVCRLLLEKKKKKKRIHTTHK